MKKKRQENIVSWEPCSVWNWDENRIKTNLGNKRKIPSKEKRKQMDKNHDRNKRTSKSIHTKKRLVLMLDKQIKEIRERIIREYEEEITKKKAM